MTEKKVYYSGSVFYSPAEDTYYEIVSGKIIQTRLYRSYSTHVKPKKLTVQKLKFVKYKIECVAIDNFKNREFYEERHCKLFIDDDTAPFFYKHNIYFDQFFKKNSIKKIFSLLENGEIHYEIEREKDEGEIIENKKEMNKKNIL
jgi:hypothetical protein